MRLSMQRRLRKGLYLALCVVGISCIAIAHYWLPANPENLKALAGRGGVHRMLALTSQMDLTTIDSPTAREPLKLFESDRWSDHPPPVIQQLRSKALPARKIITVTFR